VAFRSVFSANYIIPTTCLMELGHLQTFIIKGENTQLHSVC